MSGLSLWVVYDHPLDWPEGYIAREHIATAEGSRPTHSFVASVRLEDVRGALANSGLVRLERDPNDDPVILEVWI